MPNDAAGGQTAQVSARRLAVRLPVAAMPYFIWKITLAAVAGSLSAAAVALVSLMTLLAAMMLFILGLVLGRAGGAATAAGGSTLAVSLTGWFAIGLILDALLGLAAAGYLSQVAASLGDGRVGSFWTDISIREALVFLLFSLAGGIGGVAAACVYRSQG